MRAPVAERYTTSGKKVAACAIVGEEDELKCHKGKVLPMVMETFGGMGLESEKVLRRAEAGPLVCDGGCSPASVGQTRQGCQGERDASAGAPRRQSLC